uniref:Uncharacterized protein n=1 Tax=Saccharum hybrid cultivar R570 TaxID=131158 RepID=A0A059Q0H7_9POAL|nr:hypothetical protein SHCRBa_014_G09_F_160 [Saccharum hybrid cultivar R570]
MVGVGELLASAALKQVAGMLGTAIWDAIASQLKLSDELKYLRDTLATIVNVKSDKRLMKDGDARIWMRELKAAAYDMEDMEISIPVKLRLTMPSKLKKMKETLEKILNLRRLDSMADTSSDDRDVIQMRATGPCLEQGIVGRDKDKAELMKLLQEDCKHTIIPIYGFGGLDKAFPNGSEESDEFIKVGEKIVKKCGGVPLAVKSLADRLLDMPLRKWEETLKSELWEGERDPTTAIASTAVLPSLKISYYYMPYYLRPCFVYFAAFPKGFVIEKRDLIHRWIALGFVSTTDAEVYLQELRQMSFVEATSISTSSLFVVAKRCNRGGKQKLEIRKPYEIV